MTLAPDGHHTVVSIVKCPVCGEDLRNQQQAVHFSKYHTADEVFGR